MIIDGTWVFSSLSSPQAITVTAASTSIVDLLGVGSGNAPNATFGNATTFGEDIGIGDGPMIPKIRCIIGTTFLPTSAFLNIAIQGAPDNGSNMPGSYTTYAESGAIAGTVLLAPGTGTNSLGGIAFRLDFPPVAIGQLNAMPRFIRLNYTVTSGPFTQGTLSSFLVTGADDYSARYYPSGFTVA